MKFIQFLIPATCILLSTASCKKGGVFGMTGKGSAVTQTCNISGFNKIELSIDADLYYVQDSVYSVEISAQSNILSNIETDVSGNELEIEFDKRVLKHSKITITIHAPNIYGLEISGSGKIEAQNAINTSSMKLKISGSGDISLASLQAGILESDISGSGDISIYGGVIGTETMNISGSGSTDVLGAIAANATAKISGSGNISLYATNNLNASISGSGDIKYRGNPAVNVNVSGSGKVIHL